MAISAMANPQDALDAPLRKAFSSPKPRGASRASSPIHAKSVSQKPLLQVNGRSQQPQQYQPQQPQIYVQQRAPVMQQQQLYQQQVQPVQYQPLNLPPFKVDGMAELTPAASAPSPRPFLAPPSMLVRCPSDGNMGNANSSPPRLDMSGSSPEAYGAAAADNSAVGSGSNGKANASFGSGALFRPMDVSTMMMVQTMQSQMQQMQTEIASLRASMGELQVQLQMAKGQAQTQTAAQIDAKQTLHDTALQMKDSLNEGLVEVKELVKHKDEQSRARIFNSTCSRDRDLLEKVPNDAGELPIRFPLSRKDVSQMPLDMMQYLFDFYRMPRDPSDTLLDRLVRHIGVRL